MPLRPRGELVQEDFAIYGIDFSRLRIHDAFATPLSAAGSDDLGISSGGTFGTDAPYVTSGDVKAATTTRRLRFLFTLPPEYVTQQSVRVALHAGMITTVADGSCTVDVEAFKLDKAGLIDGTDLVTTAAMTINSVTFAEKDFELTSSALAPGDVLDIRITIACVDSATATAVIPAIAALALALDIKG